MLIDVWRVYVSTQNILCGLLGRRARYFAGEGAGQDILQERARHFSTKAGVGGGRTPLKPSLMVSICRILFEVSDSENIFSCIVRLIFGLTRCKSDAEPVASRESVGDLNRKLLPYESPHTYMFSEYQSSVCVRCECQHLSRANLFK